jgi:hypothetical protein
MHFGKGTHYHTPRNEKATNADVPTLGGAVVVHSVTGKLFSRSQVDIDFIRAKISAWSFLGRQGKYPHSFTQEFYSALRTSAYRDAGKNVFKGGLRLPRIGSA